jgi:hypothetical protein
MEVPPQAWPQVMSTPVEFPGIAEDSRERPDFGLYEFQTVDGVWVRLHEMRFLGFDYVVQPATLTMRFVYDDPKWTPLEASATPVAVFQFTDVLVWQWDDDCALMFETPQEERGQISDFGYYAPTNVFSLETLTTRLLFSAGRLVVRLEPLTNGPQPAGQDCP